MVALLGELGVRHADFLGFCLGGLTALEIAVRHPERVGRLALPATRHMTLVRRTSLPLPPAERVLLLSHARGTARLTRSPRCSSAVGR
ncbi:alpha/beta fold hydrolase [Streptomyces griseorubiginosus]|uniref:alpha/beta fold hydrolase n=1 Tax=Streptomyces griseorubiginosus TaxID=67304 RepID=UPI0035CD2541